MNKTSNSQTWTNLGSRTVLKLYPSNFPNADETIQKGFVQDHSVESKVDILLINPPTPGGQLYIRSQHRVGRHTRENMVWPQVSLAQMAALLYPTYSVKIIDANAEKIGWDTISAILDDIKPSYYLTQVSAPTLENDMYGCFLAKARGAVTIAFGTHVTPMPRESMRPYPSLDFILVGEPELTLRDLIDHLENNTENRSQEIQDLFQAHDMEYKTPLNLQEIKGLAWRKDSQIKVNLPRPFIADLDDLPIPMHELLPLKRYRMPLIKGPFTFIVTSRGCPAGCAFCIKHVTYQNSTRLRTPNLMMDEMWKLRKLGINNIHMYADLFTVNREQVMDLCQRMIDEKINIKWTCNSRVDYVDQEMLQMMHQAGNWLISWGIESGNEKILKHIHKGTKLKQVEQALNWSRKAGTKNWGYFIIGLPGETEESIRETIEFAKRLPLDIALFHIAAPHPGTPFFFEVMENGWFRPGTRWEQVDMDKETVLEYPGLSAERLMYWQKRAFREWAFRPGPLMTYLKMLVSDPSTLKSALSVGWQHYKWTFTSSD